MRQTSKRQFNFVIRSKTNLKYEVLNSGQTDLSTGVLIYQAIMLKRLNSKHKYSGCLRRIRFYDAETKKTFVFLTINFKITALTVVALYKSRWGIVPFFKWIKQHLKIQSFWGQRENAVKIQIWFAISVYLVLIIARQQLKLKYSLYEILHLISLSIWPNSD